MCCLLLAAGDSEWLPRCPLFPIILGQGLSWLVSPWASVCLVPHFPPVSLSLQPLRTVSSPGAVLEDVRGRRPLLEPTLFPQRLRTSAAHTALGPGSEGTWEVPPSPGPEKPAWSGGLSQAGAGATHLGGLGPGCCPQGWVGGSRRGQRPQQPPSGLGSRVAAAARGGVGCVGVCVAGGSAVVTPCGWVSGLRESLSGPLVTAVVTRRPL